MKNNKFKCFLKKAFSGRMAIVSTIVALILVGATLALLFSVGNTVENKFKPGSVDVEVNESIKGNTKESITLKNTGNSPAFLRVAITSHYTGTYTIGGNSTTEIIGSMPATVSFDLNESAGWVKYGNYYYYTKPVASQASTANLIQSGSGITLSHFVESSKRQGQDVQVTYKQVVEVFAEAIQSAPVDAVKAAWGDGFSISNGNLVVPTT
jgi:hypothetical protein